MFFSVWDYVPFNALNTGDVAAQWVSDEIAMRPLCGHGVHRIIDQTSALKGHLSEVIDGV